MTLIQEIIKKAWEKKYAFGTFDTSNLEVAQAIARAAEAKNMPAMIGITETAVDYAGFLSLVGLIRGVIAESSAELVLHLDHGKNVNFVKRCIDEGFQSVMIDASSYELGKNIAITKEIVDYAHKKNVIVQGELGKIPRVDPKAGIGAALKEMKETDPEEISEFVNKTGVDTLAVIAGNIHGGYKGKENPHLDFDLLKKLREKVSVPFVMHGGSGVPLLDIKKAITEYGFIGVNIDTQIRIAFVNALRDFFLNGQMTTDPRKVLAKAKDEVQKVVGEKIELFGCGKN